MPKPGLDARRLPTWGFFARNVTRVDLEDVRFTTATPDYRHVLMLSDIDRLNINGLRFPVLNEAADPILMHDVRTKQIVNTQR